MPYSTRAASAYPT